MASQGWEDMRLHVSTTSALLQQQGWVGHRSQVSRTTMRWPTTPQDQAEQGPSALQSRHSLAGSSLQAAGAAVPLMDQHQRGHPPMHTLTRN